MNQLLKITFLDYWHAGGSHGQGFHTQATVARDHDGLPYLPGRTLKGLLRDAVSQLIFVKVASAQAASASVTLV
ncbi:MAG: RAMP superfamily CRISPR-associated protein [Gammaproteobacteria bacterium]